MLSPKEYAQLPYEQRYPDHIAVPTPDSPEWEAYLMQQHEQADLQRGWCRHLGPRTSSRHPSLPSWPGDELAT